MATSRGSPFNLLAEVAVRRSSCMKWWPAFVCACVLNAPRSACAQTSVSVAPEDAPLTIQGTIGDDSTFVKRFALIADMNVSDVIVRPLDLKPTDGGSTGILRQQISITTTGKIDFGKGIPKDFDIKVTGVKRPGTYSGTFELLVPGGNGLVTQSVPLSVVAYGVPALTQRKGSDAVKIQRIDCEYIGCWIGRFLDPSAFQTEYPLQFDNPSLEAFAVNGTVATFGEVTHTSADSLLTPGTKVSIPVAALVTLPLRMNAVSLAPDHYSGDIQYRVAGRETPLLKIPLEVNVRSGPTLPLVVLFTGLLLAPSPDTSRIMAMPVLICCLPRTSSKIASHRPATR